MLSIDPKSLSGLGVLLFAAAACHFTAAAQEAGAGVVKPVWEITIAEDSFEVEYKVSAVSPKDGAIWLVLGRRPALMMSGPQTLALRTLDRSGKTQSEVPIVSLAKTAGLAGAPDQVLDIAAMADGKISLVLASGPQISVVVLEGSSGRVLLGKDIGPPRRDLLITRALPTPAGNLLLIGRSAVRAIAMKLDAKLSVVWERPADSSAVSVFLDGSVYPDESFVLAGGHSTGPRSALEVSLWLGQFDADGQLKTSAPLPGRFASLVATADGGCALVRGAVMGQALDYSLRLFDRDLKESSSVDLLSGTRDLKQFRIAAAPGKPGDFIIAGAEKHHLWLSRVRVGSGLLWSQSIGEQAGTMPELVWNFGVDSASSTVIVPFTQLVVNAKMQQRQVVKVLALDGN